MLDRMLGKPYPECVKRVVDVIMQLWTAMEGGERMRCSLSYSALRSRSWPLLVSRFRASTCGSP